MAASSSLTAYSYSFPFTTSTKSSSHPIPFSSCSFPLKHHTLLPNLKSGAAAATPTTSIEVEKSPISATPSKVLPFRVGHGFDLHRLEPGYPLIIGGINIPHDRGCEAHSDGNSISPPPFFFYNSSIFLNKYCFLIKCLFESCYHNRV
jgi:2-C-methyl-D-erythritol 2,4-cyclodiphosphate synthase